MESKTKRLRTYEELPVVVCEWHQHVLPHIHRGIASRHLPSSGLKMLHFDAHPDLTIPLKMCAADCFDKEVLYDEIEIADWILPLCYEGHVNKVIWMKPQWAHQINDGEYCIKVGEGKEDGGLRVNWKDDYFVEELLYCKEDKMLNAKDVEVQVKTLHSRLDCKNICTFEQKGNETELSFDNDTSKEDQKCCQKIAHCSCQNASSGLLESNFILDIDLDFFSTYNPFKLHHSEEDFAKLTEIYKFNPPTCLSDEHISDALIQRCNQLKMLQKTILYFVQMENLPLLHENHDYLNLINDITTKVKEDEISKNYYDLLQRIKGKQREGEQIELDLVHFAGMSSELPHHKSTIDEIKVALTNMENLLLKQPMPRIITISRSTKDDYTPPDQVDYIQESVIEMLKRLYGKISVIKDYEE